MKASFQALAVSYCALNLAGQSEAFTAPPSLPQSHVLPSQLGLVPDQGNQLVAAFNAITTDHKNQDSNAAPVATGIKVDMAVDEQQKGSLGVAKNFLAMVFNLPTVRHPAEDVVYYPMVGFRFFEGIDTVFPTVSHNCCVMPTQSQKEEEVFGWFSSSCQLDLFSENICQNPIGYEDEECIMQ
mmetsp:Transcript_830/g.1732  ORF Transcript_830/g.1732 Transcript_830/m.1732 type:complete len:183 (-) Transcript_830:415-963(-)|eukprot:CAMPEP_0197175420 /NCGR_PEP_ID=MMETSP1423-20130617/1643_1 /TAXON_ID=476441 /ORGANISM="Pseudo-nitzschia heimii, Strain UNC1101" /LENGTH=182 /DNA_ID=CAMNT_0042624583 /DNA_START=164 /DNA_END=712 /DNA_ORIENTATION=+